jgi:hypothetical protein
MAGTVIDISISFHICSTLPLLAVSGGSSSGSSAYESKGKFTLQPRDFDPRVTALARPRSNSAVNYRPVLSSERALQNNNTQMSEGNFKEKEKLDKGPRWAPDTKTDWPTNCRS